MPDSFDTLLGRMVEPFKKGQSRQIITKTPKFYLFDVGVAGSLVKRRMLEERGEAVGRAFGHFMFMGMVAYASYKGLDYPIAYWRTKSGLEADFILGDGEVAVEAKGQRRIENRDLRPLAAFMEEYRPKKAITVCNEREERVVNKIRVLPWRRFLEQLWGGGIIS